MNRRKDVELFEAIRREYQFGVGTIKGVARKLGIHRRMGALACAFSEKTAGDYDRNRGWSNVDLRGVYQKLEATVQRVQ